MSILGFEEFLNENEKPGLWANIRKKRASGRKPARKGSKAYKNAVKAAKEINETESWAERVVAARRAAGKNKTSSLARQFGLAEKTYNILDNVICMIDEGRIYGQTIPSSYPCIIAVSGTGDDLGNDGAWLIKSPEDLYRWVTQLETGNKSFPSLTGEGYVEPVEEMSEEDQEAIAKEIEESDFGRDDYGNGYVVEFFKTEESMKSRSEDSLECRDCDGTGQLEDGDCESCEGGTIDIDDIDDHDEILDGSIFPPRELTTNW